jgi:hypothetical protein
MTERVDTKHDTPQNDVVFYPPPPPALSRSSVDLSYVALWLMCLLLAGFVTYMTLQQGKQLDHEVTRLTARLDQLADAQALIAQEQARRKLAVDGVVTLAADVTTLRQRGEDRAIVLESLKGQVLHNTLELTRLQKALDTLIQRYNDLIYKKKPTLPPVEKNS